MQRCQEGHGPGGRRPRLVAPQAHASKAVQEPHLAVSAQHMQVPPPLRRICRQGEGAQLRSQLWLAVRGRLARCPPTAAGWPCGSESRRHTLHAAAAGRGQGTGGMRAGTAGRGAAARAGGGRRAHQRRNTGSHRGPTAGAPQTPPPLPPPATPGAADPPIREKNMSKTDGSGAAATSAGCPVAAWHDGGSAGAAAHGRGPPSRSVQTPGIQCHARAPCGGRPACHLAPRQPPTAECRPTACWDASTPPTPACTDRTHACV